MSRNMLDMSHVGYDIKYNYQFYIHIKSALTATHSMYTITNLSTILFISRRVVAGTVSKGSSL